MQRWAALLFLGVRFLLVRYQFCTCACASSLPFQICQCAMRYSAIAEASATRFLPLPSRRLSVGHPPGSPPPETPPPPTHTQFPRILRMGGGRGGAGLLGGQYEAL
jgi:hypothetical protein